ncbi:NADPH-dependent FMN reductase, partial [Acinetobacter junii]|nr:NADPH-dependent FMN reductase [Acinetobacter junii]
QSPSDASVDEIAIGDLETAKLYAERVKSIVEKLHS